MRYALSETEWNIIRPVLPNKSRGIPRVDDRRVLNGIFWVLRSGAPWRSFFHSSVRWFSGRLRVSPSTATSKSCTPFSALA
jgi:transposase